MRSRLWQSSVVLLSVVALGLSASQAQAQRLGRGGRGGGWSVGVGPGGVYYGQGGRYDGWGRGYSGDRFYGDRWYGDRSYGRYGDRYWSGSYPRTYYYSSPGVVHSSPGVVYQDSYAPSVTYVPSTTQSHQSFYPETITDSSKAHIRVRLPDPNAEVWFNGSPTQQRGRDRLFHTPSLRSDSSNTYEIRARWQDDSGQMRDEKRVIEVQPGQESTVEFTG
jgi:uncharacterized protein (TIGR03000 family)